MIELTLPEDANIFAAKYELYRDRRMFREKMAPDQVKPIRVLNNLENKKFFMGLSVD